METVKPVETRSLRGGSGLSALPLQVAELRGETVAAYALQRLHPGDSFRHQFDLCSDVSGTVAGKQSD